MINQKTKARQLLPPVPPFTHPVGELHVRELLMETPDGVVVLLPIATRLGVHAMLNLRLTS